MRAIARGLIITAVLLPPAGAGVRAQAAAQAAATARGSAPADLTGQWVSLVTNEWRWRMVTPPKGEYDVIPINAEARRLADAWDPAADEKAGNQCRSYGAGTIMRVPGRVRIAWADDSTMRVETDAGMQTRLFRFGRPPAPAGPPTWQGHSVAQWQPARGLGREVRAESAPARTGTLKVVTRRLRPGYLRKNGVPYSGETTVTEYFTPFTDRQGTEYFNVTVVVEDPLYLTGPYIRSMQFRKESDGSRWNPEPCSAR